MNEQHDPATTGNTTDSTDPTGQAIGTAFHERARRLAQHHAHGVHDVYRRVDEHRQRRRTIAGVGAAAVALVGVVGLTVANQRADSPAASAPSTQPAPTEVPPTTALGAIGNGWQWRCVNPVDPPPDAPADEGASYFDSCEPTYTGAGINAEDSPVTYPAVPITPTTPAPYPEPIPPTTEPDVVLESTGDGDVTYYTVKEGDSPASVASAFGIDVDALLVANGWVDGSFPFLVGEVIKVPVSVQVVGASLPELPESGDDPAIGMVAPVVSGRDFDGNPVTIDAIASQRPTLVVIAAHWCPHCDAEVAQVVSLAETGALPSDLDIVAVSTAETPDSPNWPASDWFAGNGWTFPTLADPTGPGFGASAFGAAGYPTTVVIGPDGTVLDRWTGEIGADALSARINAAVS